MHILHFFMHILQFLSAYFSAYCRVFKCYKSRTLVISILSIMYVGPILRCETTSHMGEYVRASRR